MGDRANIFMLEETREGTATGVYFYVHHFGSILPILLKNGLKRGSSLWARSHTDNSYLARVIASVLIERVGLTSESGMGISVRPCDNERPLLVVDSKENRVGASVYPFKDIPSVTRWVSFDQYVSMTDDEVCEFRGDVASLVTPLSAIDRLLVDEDS